MPGGRLGSEACYTVRTRDKDYPRILIVCEGEKTEPNYFEEIRREYRIHTANVRVLPSEAGTNPMQIVQFAEDTFRKSGKAFDKVFAVFDRDDHLPRCSSVGRNRLVLERRNTMPAGGAVRMLVCRR